jgi:hypothetical protein
MADFVVPFDPSIAVQKLQQFALEVGDLEALEAPPQLEPQC